MHVKLLVEGGSMQPGPALSQKLGPAGINISQVIQKVNEATKSFNGMKVPIELNIDTGTKAVEVKVFSPPVAELLKKELGLEKGSGLQKKTKMANASIEQIISVSKTKMPNMLSKTLKSAVKSVLGSCTSLGILVENKTPLEVMVDIDAGKYDKEISEEKTQTSEEKRKSLDEFFLQIKTEQERIKKMEEAAKAAAEAAAATTTAAGTTGEKAVTETKTEEKAKEKK